MEKKRDRNYTGSAEQVRLNYSLGKIRQDITNLLKGRLSGTGYNKINCVSLLIDRYRETDNYIEVIKFLLFLYTENYRGRKTFDKFYYWVKDYCFAVDDLEAFKLYCNRVAEYSINPVDIKSASFANGRAGELIKKG